MELAASLLLLSAAVACGDGGPRGVWMTARKDSRNHARADVPGTMADAPEEVWRIATCGHVVFARTVRVEGRDAALMQIGPTLQLVRWSGETVWRQLTLGLGMVLAVEDFEGDGRLEVLARTDVRTVVLVDVATGELLWRWQSAPSTQIIGHVFSRTPTGVRFICFPSYSTDGFCFDFSGNRREPRLLWQQSYAGKYGVGYGPNAVLQDMDRDGKFDIVLSGKVPSVSQLVLDVDTGEVKVEAHHDLDAWGRPYGLLHATDLDADGYPDVVMMSCQVEEYICVARNVDGERLEMVWGQFIEKDWPTDERELRPQVTSVADLRANDRPELVVGLWDDGAWRTAVIDPLQGFEARRGELPGLYFWGCHDITGDGRPEVICSEEGQRLTARVGMLVGLDGETLEPVARLESAALFASGTSPMPDDRYFMAIRHSPVPFADGDGTTGLLVRRFRGNEETGVFLWGARPEGEVRLRRLAGPEYTDAHVTGDELILSDGTGRTVAPGRGRKMTVSGGVSQPLLWEAGGRRELVLDLARNGIIGGVPDLRRPGKLKGAWRIRGGYPALHVDANGVARLAAADLRDRTHPQALLYTAPLGSSSSPIAIELNHPVYVRAPLMPYGNGEYRLLCNLQTGVHTLAFAAYDAKGERVWSDDGWGAYPNTMAAADLDGDGAWEVVADDHGRYRVYSDGGEVIAEHPGWPPAYNVPIVGPFGPDGKTAVLRSAGINGMALLDPAAEQVWFRSARVWQYYRSIPAVADTAGTGRLRLGIIDEDGVFECLDASTGETVWSVELGCLPSDTSVVAGDLTGNGRGEFLAGLPDGRLVCIGEEDGRGKVVWEKPLGASIANPIIADVDGDGLAEIVLSTSDGCVRILK